MQILVLNLYYVDREAERRFEIIVFITLLAVKKKYKEVQRSTKKYKEVQKSTKKYNVRQEVYQEQVDKGIYMTLLAVKNKYKEVQCQTKSLSRAG